MTKVRLFFMFFFYCFCALPSRVFSGSVCLSISLSHPHLLQPSHASKQPAAKKKEEPKPAAEAPAAGSGEPSSAAAGATEPAAAPEGGAAAPAAAAPEAAAAPPAETADAYTNTASQLMTGDALEQSINMVGGRRRRKREKEPLFFSSFSLRNLFFPQFSLSPPRFLPNLPT